MLEYWALGRKKGLFSAEEHLAFRKSEVIRRNVQTPHQDHPRGVRREKYMEYAKTNKRSWLRDEQMLKELTVFFRSEPQLKESFPPTSKASSF